MRIRAVLFTFFFVFINFWSYAYIQQDFNQLLSTQQCLHCDLTRSVMKFKPPTSNPSSKIHIDESYLTNAKIQASDFSQSTFSNSNAMRILIAHSNFIDSLFENLQLQYSLIDEVIIKDSQLLHINWNHSQFINSQFLHSYFEGLSFNGSDLRFTKWSDCQFKDIDFEQSDLRGIDFHGSQFENTRFKHADLRQANLYNTNISQQQLDEALSYVCAIMPDGKIYDSQGKENC